MPARKEYSDVAVPRYALPLLSESRLAHSSQIMRALAESDLVVQHAAYDLSEVSYAETSKLSNAAAGGGGGDDDAVPAGGRTLGVMLLLHHELLNARGERVIDEPLLTVAQLER